MVFFHKGAKSVADIATRGPKSLLFNKITILPLLFLSQREAKLHCQFRWGAWPDLPPWIRHWPFTPQKFSYPTKISDDILLVIATSFKFFPSLTQIFAYTPILQTILYFHPSLVYSSNK